MRQEREQFFFRNACPEGETSKEENTMRTRVDCAACSISECKRVCRYTQESELGHGVLSRQYTGGGESTYPIDAGVVGVRGLSSSLCELARCARGMYAGIGDSGAGRCLYDGVRMGSTRPSLEGSGSAKSQLPSWRRCERCRGFRAEADQRPRLWDGVGSTYRNQTWRTSPRVQRKDERCTRRWRWNSVQRGG